jgi:undecaprenyl-diphosphatase
MFLIQFDISITGFIFNLPHNLIFNSLFSFFSIRGMSVLIWFTIFAYLVFIEEKKHKEFIIFFLTSMVVSSFSANVIIKNIIQRPRPLYQILNSKFQIPYRLPISNPQFLVSSYPSDYSFPSGHAATSFATATILSYFDRKRKKLFYLIATLIAFSRIYLGYHYFSDVIGGAILGWLISIFILRFKSHKFENSS